jgi:hypothetical protein
MKRISAGGAGGVRVRERGAGSGALSALPRLQLELTAFTRHTVCSLTPPPLSCTPRAWGKVKIGRTIGVGNVGSPATEWSMPPATNGCVAAPSDLKVIVVDIDRASIDALGTRPWPQETMARLVEAVATGWPLTRSRHGNCGAIAGTWGNGPVHHFPVSAGPFVPRSRVCALVCVTHDAQGRRLRHCG